MDRTGAGDQHLFGFNIVWIGDANVDRTDCGTSFVIMKSDTFGAQLGIDDKHRVALRDRVVRTLGLARAAIDAIVGDHRCHEADPPKSLYGNAIRVSRYYRR